MNFLIDTNVISEIRKGPRCDRNVATWYNSIADTQVYLSVLVLGEIRKGIERSRSANGAYAATLEHWLETITTTFANRVLPVDQAVADEWGRMSAGRTVSVIDAMLAATAKVHRMTLATRNTLDIADLGADIVNPFQPIP